MFKITEQMVKEFNRVMDIKPALVRDFQLSKRGSSLLDNKEEFDLFKSDMNVESSCALLLKKAAAEILSHQTNGTPLAFSGLTKDEVKSAALYAADSDLAGLEMWKHKDYQLALELNDGNFCSYFNIYDESNAPKIEASVVMETIKYYLEEAGVIPKITWVSQYRYEAYMSTFKYFERI